MPTQPTQPSTPFKKYANAANADNAVKYYVGAHICKEKTLINTMNNIRNNGGNALQIFVSNPRSSSLVNIENYIKIAEDVKAYLKDNDFKLVIHSPYTINIASDLKYGKRTLDIEECYWVKLLLHELKISDLIGSVGVVLHVGKHVALSYEKGLSNMKTAIEFIVEEMKTANYKTKLIIETPAGQGTELLKDLNEFLAFFNSFSKEQQKYIGICLDTAHTWALGYELSEAYEILFKNNSKNIVLIHLNNSTVAKGSRKDRHAIIGEGKIPEIKMKDFLSLNIKSSKHIPIIILETPSSNYKEEIEKINKLLN
jgi:deoxyribonuclease-4